MTQKTWSKHTQCFSLLKVNIKKYLALPSKNNNNLQLSFTLSNYQTYGYLVANEKFKDLGTYQLQNINNWSFCCTQGPMKVLAAKWRSWPRKGGISSFHWRESFSKFAFYGSILLILTLIVNKHVYVYVYVFFVLIWRVIALYTNVQSNCSQTIFELQLWIKMN